MKHLIIITAMLLFGTSILSAQDTPNTYTLTVNFTGLKSSDGLLKVALCDAEEKWLSDNIVGKEGIIDGATSKVVFEIPEGGEYAISTYHDENNNDKMDTNAMGIPKEDYAFSNDAKGFFGPAKWTDAKFEVKGDMEIVISF